MRHWPERRPRRRFWPGWKPGRPAPGRELTDTPSITPLNALPIRGSWASRSAQRGLGPAQSQVGQLPDSLARLGSISLARSRLEGGALVDSRRARPAAFISPSSRRWSSRRKSSLIASSRQAGSRRPSSRTQRSAPRGRRRRQAGARPGPLHGRGGSRGGAATPLRGGLPQLLQVDRAPSAARWTSPAAPARGARGSARRAPPSSWSARARSMIDWNRSPYAPPCGRVQQQALVRRSRSRTTRPITHPRWLQVEAVGDLAHQLRTPGSRPSAITAMIGAIVGERLVAGDRRGRVGALSPGPPGRW